MALQRKADDTATRIPVGLTLTEEEFVRLDNLVAHLNYKNRASLIRDLIAEEYRTHFVKGTKS